MISCKTDEWSSYPTYPGGDPMILETLLGSLYSDISNFTKLRFNNFAKDLAVCVLPIPLPPTNKYIPLGF